MPIQFHCPMCNAHIKAPDDAGGKSGKCPTCHQQVHIPLPDDELIPIDLAPLDSAAEARREAMEAEARELRNAAFAASEASADRGGVGGNAGAVDVRGLVISYVAHLANGELENAERIAARIYAYWPQAEGVIDDLGRDEVPPSELTRIPGPVINGFLKQLRAGAPR